jgi:hypothetical protein
VASLAESVERGIIPNQFPYRSNLMNEESSDDEYAFLCRNC